MYTYVISTDNKEFVKIGFTRDMYCRFQSIRSASPLTMKLEGYFSGDIEKKLLKKYKAYNVRSEWFRYDVLALLKLEVGFTPLEHSLDITNRQITDAHATDVLYYLKLHAVCDLVELTPETTNAICKSAGISVYYFDVCVMYLWISKRFIFRQYNGIAKNAPKVYHTKNPN